MAIRLGDLLVRNGVLTETQREQVLDRQRLTGRPFGELAETMFGVSQHAVERAWAEQYAMIAQRVDPHTEKIDPVALAQIDRRQAWQFCMLPLRFDGDELMVCTTQAHLVRAMRFAGWRIKAPCYFVLSDPVTLGKALMRHYRMDGMHPAVVRNIRRASA
jgi:hypothetical protein